MFKVITGLALAAGGAATYIWLRKSGRTSHLESGIDHAVNKVHNAFTNDESSNDMAAKLRDKTNDGVENVTEQVGAASS